MNPLDSIKNNLSSFTKKEKQIAEYILKNPIEAIQDNPATFSTKANSSKSAFVRMCKKIGYNGYSEFRFALSNFLISSKEPVANEKSNPVQSITNTYIEFIKLMQQNILPDTIIKISDFIFEAERIKVFGMNRTGLSAQQLRMRLAKLGYDSEAIVDFILMEDVVNSLSNKDLAIIFSITGNRYNHLVDELNENGTEIILITMNADSSLKNKISLEIVLPLISRGTPRFLDDQALFFIFIEIILAALTN